MSTDARHCECGHARHRHRSDVWCMAPGCTCAGFVVRLPADERALRTVLTPTELRRLNVAEPAPPLRPRVRGTFPIIIRELPDLSTPTRPISTHDLLPRQNDAHRRRLNLGNAVARDVAISAATRNDERVFQGLVDMAACAVDGDSWSRWWSCAVDFAQRSPRTNRRLRTNAEFDGGCWP